MFFACYHVPCSGFLIKPNVIQHLSLVLRCTCSGTHREILLNCSFMLEVLPQRGGCKKQSSVVWPPEDGQCVLLLLFHSLSTFPCFFCPLAPPKPNLGAQHRGPRGRVKKEEVLSESLASARYPQRAPLGRAPLPSVKAGGTAVLPWRDPLRQHTFPSPAKHKAG